VNKDYYTKKEVDDLIMGLKKEIIEMFSSKNSSELTRWFKLHNGMFPHNQYDLIYDGLLENGLISGPKKMFWRVLSEGLVAEEHGIKWTGPKNLCVYMFDLLEDRNIIESSLFEQKIEKIFGIVRAAKTKSKYTHYLKGLPRGYKKVDDALKPFFDLINAEKIANQDMLENPDDYGLNDIP
jgi:hypothetical protein